MFRKTIIIIFFLLICLLITSCKKEEPIEEIKEVFNIPKVIDLKTDLSPGSTWQYTIRENQDIVEVSKQYIERCNENQIRCPGITSFTIKGIKPGKVTIEFQLISNKKKQVKKDV